MIFFSHFPFFCFFFCLSTLNDLNFFPNVVSKFFSLLNLWSSSMIFCSSQSFFQRFLDIFISGDEILVVNGKSLQGMKHDEAINVFKSIKTGDVVILIGRRLPKNRNKNDSIDTTTTAATVTAEVKLTKTE